LFEYCYLGKYASQQSVPNKNLEIVKNIFMWDAKALVVANKYIVDKMADLAAERIEEQIDRELSVPDHDACLFFKFVVETVYLWEHLFGYDQDAVDEGVRMKKVMKTKEKDEAAGQDDENMSDVDNSHPIPDGHADGIAIAHPDVDFDPRDLNAITSTQDPRHTLDRLRSIVAKAAVNVWKYHSDTLGRRHFAVLVKEVPVFGTDLAAAALPSHVLV
jgi:hypothetical protein